MTARRGYRSGPGWRIAHLDALLSIVITGLVFAIVLAPRIHLTGAALVATIGFHYVSPWTTLLIWLVFGLVLAAAFKLLNRLPARLQPAAGDGERTHSASGTAAATRPLSR